jgi:hypothetical protein
MFGFFGLDPIHWLILLGVPALVIVVVLLSRRGTSATAKDSDEVAELRAEVERLRAEVQRLKKGTGSS